MKSENITLANSCREVFLIIDKTISLGQLVKLPIGDTTTKISIHKDNAEALILDKAFAPKFNPWSKYYAS